MIARALAASVVAAALVAAVAIEHVRASASELATDLGPALLAYAGATRDEGQRTLLVNGAKLEMRTGITEDSIETVLDRQREACGPTHVPLPLLRWSSQVEGVLGCAVMPDRASLFERLQALGELRVTWVIARGEARRYVIVSSRDALALSRMFPAHDDAPGQDVPGLPRPPAARRILSAAQQGAEPTLVAYRSERSLRLLEREYRAALEERGRSVERVAVPDGSALLVQGGASPHLVLLGRDGDGALAVIVPLPTQPRR